MGLCHEFGSQIRTGCDHPMRAGASACSCAECGVVCRGLFDGCPDVWARGPRPVSISATRAGSANGAPAALGPGAGTKEKGNRTIRVGTPTAPAAIGPAPEVVADPGVKPPAGDRRAAADDRATRTDAGRETIREPVRDTGREPGREAHTDPRREVFRWFEEAFGGVRGELQALIGSMTHQQAMLAELLDSRQAELRLALVAESLPDIVADAVQTAMEAHSASLAKTLERSQTQLRADADHIRAATETSVEALNESFQRLADSIAVHDEEAEERETMRLAKLKASVTRQITPLGEALADLGARIDALADRIDTQSAPPPAIRAEPKAPSRPLAAAKASARARTAAATAPAPVVQAPAPPWTPVVPPKPASSAAPVLPRRAAAAAPARAPAAGKLVSSPRMQPPAVDDDDEQPVTPRRITTRSAPGRVARGVAAASPAEPTPRPTPAASRAAAPRTASPRTNGAPDRPVTRRVSTARVSASMAADAADADTDIDAPNDDAPDDDAPETAIVPRLLSRRRAAQAAPPPPADEPLVVYELETDADTNWAERAWTDDDDADADWSPPAWVSKAAAASDEPNGPPPVATRKPSGLKAAVRARRNP